MAAAARRAPGGRWRALVRRARVAGDGALLGALIGLAVAGAALAVGLARLGLALLGGRSAVLGARDAATLAAYVGALVAAGALVGAVNAAWQHRAATGAACVAGGVFAMNAIARLGGPYDRSAALWMSLIGAAFGVALAFGLTKRS
jgi:hypothetical protein